MPGSSVSGPCTVCTRGQCVRPKERETEQPGVIVDEIELVHMFQQAQGVLELPEALTDVLRRRGVERRHGWHLRRRITGGEERHVDTRFAQPSANRCTTDSTPPYRSGGTGNHAGLNRPTLTSSHLPLPLHCKSSLSHSRSRGLRIRRTGWCKGPAPLPRLARGGDRLRLPDPGVGT